jgi:hypothetical protein
VSVNLIKLCVGVDSVEDLADSQTRRLKTMHENGEKNPELRHVTRNTPRRAAEVLDGGSLYWVIRRVIQVRQRITGLEKVEREDGKPACAIMLAPELIRTHPRSFRPFQGWRYFPTSDVPADLPPDFDIKGAIPVEMADELRTLGLI